MLHNIMKQYSREFIKIPVLRKLLKVCALGSLPSFLSTLMLFISCLMIKRNQFEITDNILFELYYRSGYEVMD